MQTGSILLMLILHLGALYYMLHENHGRGELDQVKRKGKHQTISKGCHWQTMTVLNREPKLCFYFLKL